MPNTLIYGKIIFCEKQNKRELQEIAYDMMAKAITHRFGLEHVDTKVKYDIINT